MLKYLESLSLGNEEANHLRLVGNRKNYNGRTSTRLVERSGGWLLDRKEDPTSLEFLYHLVTWKVGTIFFVFLVFEEKQLLI